MKWQKFGGLGKICYDKLKAEQVQELDNWYMDWLDVTETLVEPQKPDWLK